MDENNPDTHLCALRQSTEAWLTENGEYLDKNNLVVANTLTLWAASFLRVTEEAAHAAETRIKQQGAQEFMARIRQHASDIRAVVDLDPLQALGLAFETETLRRHIQSD